MNNTISALKMFSFLAAIISSLVICLIARVGAQEKLASQITESMVTAASAITVSQIEEIVTEIASDAYEGRGPGTIGDLKTQNYLIDQLKRFGYVGGGNKESWRQPFDLIGLNTKQPKTWSFETSRGTATFEQHSDFILASGEQASRSELENAELVFVGYGIQAPE